MRVYWVYWVSVTAGIMVLALGCSRHKADQDQSGEMRSSAQAHTLSRVPADALPQRLPAVSPLSDSATAVQPNKNMIERKRQQLLLKEQTALQIRTVVRVNPGDPLISALAAATAPIEQLYRLLAMPKWSIWQASLEQSGSRRERRLFQRNGGPWCRMVPDPACNALIERPPRVLGVGFWPKGMNRTRFEGFKRDIGAAELLAPNTVVEDAAGGFAGKPYTQSHRFGKLANQVVARLQDAAALAKGAMAEQMSQGARLLQTVSQQDHLVLFGDASSKVVGRFGFFRHELDPFGVKADIYFFWGVPDRSHQRFVKDGERVVSLLRERFSSSGDAPVSSDGQSADGVKSAPQVKWPQKRRVVPIKVYGRAGSATPLRVGKENLFLCDPPVDDGQAVLVSDDVGCELSASFFLGDVMPRVMPPPVQFVRARLLTVISGALVPQRIGERPVDGVWRDLLLAIAPVMVIDEMARSGLLKPLETEDLERVLLSGWLASLVAGEKPGTGGAGRLINWMWSRGLSDALSTETVTDVSVRLALELGGRIFDALGSSGTVLRGALRKELTKVDQPLVDWVKRRRSGFENGKSTGLVPTFYRYEIRAFAGDVS